MPKPERRDSVSAGSAALIRQLSGWWAREAPALRQAFLPAMVWIDVLFLTALKHPITHPWEEDVVPSGLWVLPWRG